MTSARMSSTGATATAYAAGAPYPQRAESRARVGGCASMHVGVALILSLLAIGGVTSQPLSPSSPAHERRSRGGDASTVDDALALREQRALRLQSDTGRGRRQASTCAEIGCGNVTLGQSCNCDNFCLAFNDCCSDYSAVCLSSSSPTRVPTRAPTAAPTTASPTASSFMTVVQDGYLIKSATTFTVRLSLLPLVKTTAVEQCWLEYAWQRLLQVCR
jgi:hypothetical protein